MSFKECLNEYIKQIQCTGKELAVSSGISETVISRYRKGERMPSADSEYLKKLSDGIIKIAETKMIQDFNAEQVFEKLRKSLMTGQKELHFDNQKVNLLLTELDINISKIAAFMHYDPSYLSKIRNGKRSLAHYYLTSRKEEVAVSKKNMEFLLKKASSLMDIYRKERRNKLNIFLDEDMHKEGHRRRVLAAPALGTMSEQLLEKILKRNAICGNERKIVLECYTKQKERLEMILSHSTVEDEISEIISEEYEKYPLVLSLAECFLEKDIQLSYDEYLSGIREAEAYAENHKNYTVYVTQMKGFRNIQITCFEGKWCMVSKNRAPAIHFVIHHPKLRYALENMTLPIQDGKM